MRDYCISVERVAFCSWVLDVIDLQHLTRKYFIETGRGKNTTKKKCKNRSTWYLNSERRSVGILKSTALYENLILFSRCFVFQDWVHTKTQQCFSLVTCKIKIMYKNIIFLRITEREDWKSRFIFSFTSWLIIFFVAVKTQALD